MKILETLRLTESGYSQRNIAASVGCAKSTVGEIQRRSREAGLCYEQAQGLTNEALQELLYPGYTAKKFIKPEPDYEFIHKELQKHPRLNLRFMWEEYKSKNPSGLEYSQFCERYSRWIEKPGRKVTMHHVRVPDFRYSTKLTCRS